jgi:hypothetical protein
MIPRLSDEAWALLGLLYRAGRGRAPKGFRDAYKELRANGLVEENTITEKGEATLRDKFSSENKSLPPRGVR